jgi:hypothetical protein
MSDPVVSQRAIPVEHVRIESAKPFVEVKAALEGSVPQLDTGIFTLLQRGESDRARQQLERGLELSIFGSRDHGALLQITGQPRRAVQYDIGQSAHRYENDATPTAGLAIRAAARRAV